MSALLNIIPIDSKPRRNPVRHYAATDLPHFSVAELKTFLERRAKARSPRIRHVFDGILPRDALLRNCQSQTG